MALTSGLAADYTSCNPDAATQMLRAKGDAVEMRKDSERKCDASQL
jgi:hypothetical protein